MKRVKHLAISGIQSKILYLILITVGLLTAAYLLSSHFQSNTLTKLVAETNEKQETAISNTTSAVFDDMVKQTLGRSNKTEARVADETFEEAGNRVTYLAEYAEKLFAAPEAYAPKPYAGPDPADDGTWCAKVIYADGTNPDDPAVKKKLGLLSNMNEMMISLCPAFKAANVYIAMPEGVHLSVSDNSSSWFEDGQIKSYDPRTRGWYQKAVEKGKLVFTDGERDANTGSYCIECAKPVYHPDGSLAAVVGADLYLDELQDILEGSSVSGEGSLLINQSGHAVFEPQEAAFPMAPEDRGGDLRESSIPMLAQVAENALQGKGTSVVLGEMLGGRYYVTASPISSTGWVLISAYSEEIAGRTAVMMQEKLGTIQEESLVTYRTEKGRLRRISIISLLALAMLTLGAAIFLGRRIVTPLTTITKKISKLGGDDLEFTMEDSYRTGDEVEELAESFSELTQRTRNYMDEVVKVTAEKERIGAELSLATDIQAAMLPHIFPAFPNRPDFDIYASMNPAKEVGGDFYDYFLIDDDHLCMVIADVSGKGVPAALFMMASKIILQSVAMLGTSPAEVLAKTNEALCSNNEAEMFVTVWLGIVELSTGKMVAANAGHEYPTVKQPDGRFELLKDKHGFVLGGMEGAAYKEYEVELKPGAKIFVYTDGVPEATNAENELFGTERMVDALNEKADAPPQEILAHITSSVNRFVKEAEQFDDLTMLCFEYIADNKKTYT